MIKQTTDIQSSFGMSGYRHAFLPCSNAAAHFAVRTIDLSQGEVALKPATDTRKGWARDSYSNYTQFRYSEAVNVIGFIYSVFQFVALVELMRRNKHLIPHPKRDLFDFTMDQVLTYLLISSSSSATARVSDLIDNWGSDPFPSMANGSIAISFLAFAVFAICSLISAYNLFRRDV